MDAEQQLCTPQKDMPAGSKLSQQDAQLCDASGPKASEAENAVIIAEDQQAEFAPDWMSSILQNLLNTEVKAALDSVLLPRTQMISQEVKTMQQEGHGVSIKVQEEHAEVQDDLARMAKLVYDFQTHISQFLLDGVAMAHSPVQASPESDQDRPQ